MPIHFSDQTELFSEDHTPGCLRSELGTCPGPCAARCSTSAYRERMDEAVQFLSGETDAPLDRLLRRTTEAAAEREYEFAAQLGNREAQLRRLRDEVVSFRDFLAGLSFVCRAPSEPSGPDVGYLIRRGIALFSFDFPSERKPRNSLKSRVRAALSRPPSPYDESDAELREQRFLVARWFRWNPDERRHAIDWERFLNEPLHERGHRSSP